MNTPINRLPQGLLDFLGIRSGGRNPQQLTEQLLPTMDLSDWYKQNASREVQVTATSLVADTSAGFFSLTVAGAVFEVPNNEIWIMRRGTRVNWDLQLGAVTQQSDMTLVHRNVTANRWAAWPMSDLMGYTTSSTVIVRSGLRSLLDEIWLNPGDRPQILNLGTSASALQGVTPAVYFNYVRLRI